MLGLNKFGKTEKKERENRETETTYVSFTVEIKKKERSILDHNFWSFYPEVFVFIGPVFPVLD